MNEQALQQLRPQYLDEYIESLRNRNVSERTLAAYRSDIIKFLQYCQGNGGRELNNLQPQDIERYVRELAHDGAKFSSLKRSLIVLKEFLGFLLDKGVLLSNPVAGVRIGRVHQDALTSDEILSIFRYLNERQESNNPIVRLRYQRDELILLFMLFHGVRQYQIPTLKLSAIQQTGDSLALAVNKHRTVKLSGNVLIKLREYLTQRNSNADVMFNEPVRRIQQRRTEGGPLTVKHLAVSSIQSLLHELSYALNLQCTPTSLYHTYLYLQNRPEETKKLLSLLTHDQSHNPVNHARLPLTEFSGGLHA